ncbi:hypothetical protein H0H81_004186 [Sphagnurus paluster]|uniref:Uncharacterized protein n=1 Tax=Sphagnurus paluster TaxID=117069 RepID=A0A9P7FLM5_9AGAR|nr:hypothetical protein H0H81_004186 [Sphagnurus paluster]
MPSRQDPIAPSLVTASNGTPELARFFEDLEFLFDNCLIQSDAAKKKHTMRYLDTPTARLWRGLEPSYMAGSYEEWKAAIHALYPGTSEDRRYSFRDLHALVDHWYRHGISNLRNLGEFYRQFLAVSSFLVLKQRISAGERDRVFQSAFNAKQWTQIHERLIITDVNHHPEDPWPISSVFTAAQYILYDTAPSILHAFQPSHAEPSTTPTPVTISKPQPFEIPYAHAPDAPPSPKSSINDTKPVTLENKAIFDVFQQILMCLEQIRPQDHQRRAIECYFCSTTGHRIREWPQVELSIRAGKCMRNAEERIVLPSGARVPNHVPGKNLRDRIDECYRCDASNHATGLAAAKQALGTMLYETHGTSTPNSMTTAFDVDQQIHPLEQQLRRIWSHEFHNDVPALVSIAAPCKPALSYVHELHQPAPVGSFSQPFPLPQSAESNTTSTPVNLARAAAVPKPAVPVPPFIRLQTQTHNQRQRRTTLIIAPAPDVSAGEPCRLPPAESKTTPVIPAAQCPIEGTTTTPPARTPAVSPVTPEAAAAMSTTIAATFNTAKSAYRTIAATAPSTPARIRQSPPPGFTLEEFTGTTTQAPTMPPSSKSAPVSHPPPFFATPPFVPAAPSEEHAATPPRPPASFIMPKPVDLAARCIDKPARVKTTNRFIRAPSRTCQPSTRATNTLKPVKQARCTTSPTRPAPP